MSCGFLLERDSHKNTPFYLNRYYDRTGMRQEERASIMRIVSDLIKADGIIDTREIDYLDDLRAK